MYSTQASEENPQHLLPPHCRKCLFRLTLPINLLWSYTFDLRCRLLCINLRQMWTIKMYTIISWTNNVLTQYLNNSNFY